MPAELKPQETPAPVESPVPAMVDDYDGQPMETKAADTDWDQPPIRSTPPPATETTPSVDAHADDAAPVTATDSGASPSGFSDELLDFAEYAGIPRAMARNFKDANALQASAQWVIDQRLAQEQARGLDQKAPDDTAPDDWDLEKELGEDFDPKLKAILKRMHDQAGKRYADLRQDRDAVVGQLQNMAVAEQRRAMSQIATHCDQWFSGRDELWQDQELLGKGKTSALPPESKAAKNRNEVVKFAARMARGITASGEALPDLPDLLQQASHALLAEKAFARKQELAAARTNESARRQPVAAPARNGTAVRPADRMRSEMDEIFKGAGLDPNTGRPA